MRGARGVREPDERWDSVTRREIGWCSATPAEMTYGAADRRRGFYRVIYRQLESRRKLAVFVINQPDG